jgi:Cu(I)/Ag(I) efflux system membrane fusion protein
MKNKKTIFAAAVLIAIGATSYGLYRLGMHQGMKMSAPITMDSPAANGANGSSGAEKKVLYWHDPMVPAQQFDKPGKSPFMDMQLVPVYADAAGDEGTVKISPRVQQNLGIRTAEVTKGTLTSVVTAVGNVAYNERDVALLQARSNGFVERLYVRAPLDPVKQGQALAELYVPEWVAAQEEYLSVKRMQGSGMTELLGAARQRMRLVGMSEGQIRLVENSGTLHPRLTVTAPIGGVISELNVRDGMTVMAGAPLFRINGLATIWVNADVPENLAAQVRPGNAVEARTPSLPGIVFKGKVGAILPEVNPATRTLKARVELANPSGQLVPGMFATLSLSTAPRAEVLLVPTEAVIKTGTRSVVMAALGDGKFIPVDVETGAEANGQTEIRKGLEEGQKVVVSGQFLIDSEASLRGTSNRMGATKGPDSDQAADPSHRGEGKVERIEQDEITISHGPIPSLQWGPMTMGFHVPASGLPKGVAVGDKVEFEIRPAKNGMFDITSIAPMKGAPPATPAMPTGVAK